MCRGPMGNSPLITSPSPWNSFSTTHSQLPGAPIHWTWSSPLSSSDHCCLLTPLPWDSECRHREHGLSEVGKGASISALGYPCLGVSLGELCRGSHLPHPKTKSVSALRLQSISGHLSTKGWDGRLWKGRAAPSPQQGPKVFILHWAANSQLSLNPHHFKHWVLPYFFNCRPRGLHQLKKNFLEGKIMFLKEFQLWPSCFKDSSRNETGHTAS